MGPQGPAGPQGPPGASGVSNVFVRSGYMSLGAFETKTGSALCAPGEKVLGGGYDPSTAGSTSVYASYPDTGLTDGSGAAVQGWSARGGLNFGWASGGFAIYAVCGAP